MNGKHTVSKKHEILDIIKKDFKTFNSSDEESSSHSVRIIKHTYISSKREVTKVKKEIIEISDNSFDNDSDTPESIETLKTYLDFHSEIETIFKEVYTYYLNPNNNGDIDITLTIKETMSARIVHNDKLIFAFSTFLIQTISRFIKNNKKQILLITEHKNVKEQFLKLKKQINESMNNSTSDQVRTKYENDIITFCTENQFHISNIIKDLFKVYYIITTSSAALDHIFKSQIKEIRNSINDNFNINDLHVEEFCNVIINDSFIKALICEIKMRNMPNFLMLRGIIDKIESDVKYTKNVINSIKEWILINHTDIDDLKDGSIDMDCDVNFLNHILLNSVK
jgi:hypothetical protein